MVIMEMMKQYVNHVQDIVKPVQEQQNLTVPNATMVTMPNMIMLMNVRPPVMLDITKMMPQRHVTHVMTLVHAVLQQDQAHVLVVKFLEVYIKIHVLIHAQTIITIMMVFVMSVMLLVKLVTDQPDTNVTLVMKPLIYKMENVLTIVILDLMKMKLTTNVNHVTILVKNVSLEMNSLAKNVMMEHI